MYTIWGRLCASITCVIVANALHCTKVTTREVEKQSASILTSLSVASLIFEFLRTYQQSDRLSSIRILINFAVSTSVFIIGTLIAQIIFHTRILMPSVADYQKPISPFHKLMAFMERVPEKYRKGNWNPATHVIIFVFSGGLLLTASDAFSTYNSTLHISAPTSPLLSTASDWQQLYRICFGSWGLIVSIASAFMVGPLVMASYTLTSWNLMTCRVLFSFMAIEMNLPALRVISDALLFPAIAGCTVTVFVWWLALVPVIYNLIDTNEGRAGFIRFNLSFALINLHLLNLPIILVEFFLTGRQLNEFDLWIGIAVSILYCIFYLNVLDASGNHFYIIFTPRTVFSSITYSLVVAIYYICYRFWNTTLSTLSVN